MGRREGARRGGEKNSHREKGIFGTRECGVRFSALSGSEDGEESVLEAEQLRGYS